MIKRGKPMVGFMYEYHLNGGMLTLNPKFHLWGRETTSKFTTEENTVFIEGYGVLLCRTKKYIKGKLTPVLMIFMANRDDVSAKRIIELYITEEKKKMVRRMDLKMKALDDFFDETGTLNNNLILKINEGVV